MRRHLTKNRPGLPQKSLEIPFPGGDPRTDQGRRPKDRPKGKGPKNPKDVAWASSAPGSTTRSRPVFASFADVQGVGSLGELDNCKGANNAVTAKRARGERRGLPCGHHLGDCTEPSSAQSPGGEAWAALWSTDLPRKREGKQLSGLPQKSSENLVCSQKGGAPRTPSLSLGCKGEGAQGPWVVLLSGLLPPTRFLVTLS